MTRDGFENHFSTRTQTFTVRQKGLLAVMLAGYALLALRHAWLADDAYITLRMVDNFLSGHGLRWNPSERVLACTHPLWLLILIPICAVTGEAYFSTIFLSWTLSLLTVWLIVAHSAKSFRSAAIALLALCMSKSAMDYSSSGLENPLTHFLCGLFWMFWCWSSESRARYFALGLVFSLAITTRHDALLLLLPAMAFEIVSRRSLRHMGWIALGTTPFVAWELFSIAYYGFPFPNTAYAKLNMAVPRTMLLTNGWRYLFHTIMFDPLTLVVISATALVLAAARQWKSLIFMTGGLLYIAYITWVGGDFMSGRYFSAPMMLAVLALSRLDLTHLPRTTVLLLALGLTAGGMLNRNPTLLVSVGSSLASEVTAHDHFYGIHDERSYYFRQTGLLAGWGHERWPEGYGRTHGEEMRREGEKVQTHYAIGLPGYYAGPGVHIIDILGLADPLIARLEFMGIHRNDAEILTQWGSNVLPGHYERPVPVGYFETHATGENKIADPHLREFYDHLRLITQGEIWSRERWSAICKMNTGAFDPLLNAYETASKSRQ